MIPPPGVARLDAATRPSREKILNPDALPLHGGIASDTPVLVLLAAGKGTRFGQAPKCIQLVHGTPLARHSIDAFRQFAPGPAICLVGYRHGDVAAALGADNIYVIRATALHERLRELTNANAQQQYYLTDIVEAIHRRGGDIRTVTISVVDPEYDLLCSDVTRPADLALLESVVGSSRSLLAVGSDIEVAARAIASDRPAVQVAAIARQLAEMAAAAAREKLDFQPDQPVAIGISGGRFRIAFMHPDMGRFFGPAWQMPIGAGSPDGDEQIVMLTQSAGSRQIHLFPTNPRFRENVNTLSSDTGSMYPGEEISDWNSYEEFGTRMSENLLLALGYFSDEELQRRREKGQPLPPASQWLASSMRRPFSLVGNAIASLRTLRKGRLGAQVQLHLGRDGFQGLRIVTTGNVPKGGFSSSSAVTVATKNAINALFDLGVPPDLLVHLACQAEYGTGVRAGSLDQATEQKGRAGCGTLISSNPRENFRIIGTYPLPAERFQVIFPYSIERDREAWKWSWGAYAETASQNRLTTSEMRKLTGKAAEIAALLIRLPLETDLFKGVEEVFGGGWCAEPRKPDVGCRCAPSAALARVARRTPSAPGWQSGLVSRPADRECGTRSAVCHPESGQHARVAFERLARSFAAADDIRRHDQGGNRGAAPRHRGLSVRRGGPELSLDSPSRRVDRVGHVVTTR
ncbi:MAG: hypothetical protein EXS37_07110 [Opitutus sp.]|nr:hypothetical protein [Opitutus sp.]